jgi:hypothetical protein
VDKVVVHPLVLLSVVDHYNRVAKDSKKRVVGVILGESYKGRIDATNSFAGAAGGGRLLQFKVLLTSRMHACLANLTHAWRKCGRDASLLSYRPSSQCPRNSACSHLRSALTAVVSRQCPLRRMTRTPPSGSWTTATWRQCAACSRRSTVSSGGRRKRGRHGEPVGSIDSEAGSLCCGRCLAVSM